MLKMIKRFLGNEKYSKEEQHWVQSLETLLSDEDPDSLQRWFNENTGKLNWSFVVALSDVLDRLLHQTSIASTQQLFRLNLLVSKVIHRTLAGPWGFELVKILKTLEEDGVGPRSSLSKTPADVYKRVFNYRGCCLAERGEYTAAIEHFGITLDIDPHFAPAYCNRARAWLELNQLDRAWADCEALRSFDPDYSVGRATCQLVETLRRLKTSREGTVAEIAEEHGLLEFLRRYDRPLKLGEHVRALARSINPLEATEVREDDATPEQLNHLGVVRGRSGDYEGAIRAFNKALEMSPEYEEARWNRGKAYQLAGEYEKAIADFSFVLERNPEDTDAYHLWAQAYRATRKVAEAEADEKRIHQLRFEG